MIKRKLIKQGTSSLTISLPAHWIKQFNLKAGDEINLVEKDKDIILTTTGEIKVEPVEINVSGYDDRLVDIYVVGSYISGVDQLKLVFEDKSRLDKIQDITRKLIGMAVIEQGNNYCVIEEISKTTAEQFDKILRKIFLLILSISEDTSKAIENKDKEALKGMPSRDKDINQFVFLCLRLLNKFGSKLYKRVTLLYMILEFLEKVADKYAHIAEFLYEADMTIKKDIIDVFKNVNKQFRIFYEIFYKYDIEKLTTSKIGRHNLEDKIESMMVTKNRDELMILFHLRRILRNIRDMRRLTIANSVPI